MALCDMNTGFCSAQAKLLGELSEEIHAFQIFFSGLREVVEKAPQNFNPLSTQKHRVGNSPRMLSDGLPGSTHLQSVCQLLLALRVLERVLTAAPCRE